MPLEIKIYYEDTDCGGVVYYANYLKYFERARTHYLEDRGLSVASLKEHGTLFLVTHAELTYRSPARYGEILLIDTEVSINRRSSLTFKHFIREQLSNRLVVEGSATLVVVNGQHKIKRIDEVILKALKN